MYHFPRFMPTFRPKGPQPLWPKSHLQLLPDEDFSHLLGLPEKPWQLVASS